MTTEEKKIIFAAAHVINKHSTFKIEVFDLMYATPKFLYEYDTGIKYDEVADGEYCMDICEYKYDGYPAIFTDVSPDGKILVYTTTKSLHMVNFNESYECVNRKEHKQEGNEYEIIEILKGRNPCASSAFRYLKPELGILMHGDGRNGYSVLYQNVNTGELKIHSGVQTFYMDFPENYYELIISELSLTDYCGKAYLFEPKLNIHENEIGFYSNVSDVNCFKPYKVYKKMLDYNTSIGKKYNIINDGKSVRITINYKGTTHNVTLVPEDCY